jgi:hypothetical protein
VSELIGQSLPFVGLDLRKKSSVKRQILSKMSISGRQCHVGVVRAVALPAWLVNRQNFGQLSTNRVQSSVVSWPKRR